MYDVQFLNKNLEIEYRCTTIDFLWDSKLFDVGEFQLQILTDEDLVIDNCSFVAVNDKNEIGLIQRYEYSSDEKNTMIISGYFAERLFFESVIYPVYQTTTGTNVWSIADAVCDTYLNADIKAKFSSSSFPVRSSGSHPESGADSIAAFQQTGDTIGDLLYSLVQQFGYRIQMNILSSEWKGDIVPYVDRSGDDEDYDAVVFSVSFNNLKSYDVVIDNSDCYNYAIVAGQGEGSDRIVEYVNAYDNFVLDSGSNYVLDSASNNLIFHNGDGRKKCLWVDAKDLQQDDDTTEADYRKILIQRGQEKLAEHQTINSIEVELTQEEAENVGTNYNLGDIVQVVINPVQLSYTMQITEIEDVYNAGKRSTTIVFDNKGCAGWQKVKRYMK